MNKIKLRDYQKDAIDNIEANIAFGETNLILKAQTSFGKSITLAGLCERFKHQKIVIIVNIEPLIDQIAFFLKELNIDYSILKAGRESEFNSDSQVKLVMAQTLYARLDKINIQADMVVRDECFTPDVEILTEKGFIRFDKLKNEKVAQFNSTSNNISFIEPIRKIQYKYEGEIYNISTRDSIDVSVTPNHDFLINNKKVKTKDIVYSNEYKINVAGYGIGESKKLTQYEKLAIAFQADGSLHHEYIDNEKISPSIESRIGFIPKKGQCSILFSFSKERKIKQLIADFKSLNIKELKKQYSKRKNTKPRRRFIISQVDRNKISKKLSDIFDLKDFSVKKARDFIEYMVIWDGHINSKANYYYSSAIKENADFIQAVAILAGYKAKISVQVDNRKKSYSDIYRVFISKNKNQITTQCIKNNINTEHYSGDIYCVEVPDSNIIVRKNGKAIVIGNCHREYNQKRTNELLKHLEPEVIVGLTATPYDQTGYKLAGSTIVNTVDTEWLTKNGYLSPIKYYIPKWSETLDYSLVTKSGNDYVLDELDEILTSEKNMPKILKAMNDMKCKNKKALVFCTTIEQCSKITDMLVKDGYLAKAYHSKNKKKDNEEILKAFTNNTTYKQIDYDKTLFEGEDEPEEYVKCLVSVSKLTTGFSVNDIDIGVSLRSTQIRSLFEQIAGRIRRTSNSLDDILNKHADITNSNDKLALVCSVYNEKKQIEKQLKEKNILNVDVFEFGSEPQNYNFMEYNVRPNKTHGEYLDLAQNVKTHGFPEEEYNPPERTGITEIDKKALQETLDGISLDKIAVTIDSDKPEEITRANYNMKIQQIEKDSRRLTNLTLKELYNKLEVSTDPVVLISITAVLLDKIKCSDGFINKFNKECRGYISNKGKEVKDFLNPNTIGWIAQDWINALDKEDSFYKNKYIKALRTRCKNTVKDSGSIYALKYFIQFLLEKDELEKQIQEEPKSNITYTIEDSNGIEIEIDEDEIPF